MMCGCIGQLLGFDSFFETGLGCFQLGQRNILMLPLIEEPVSDGTKGTLFVSVGFVGDC